VDGVNGDDGNGGTGWSDAFATIGKALDVAGDYDVVLVADATYNETDLNFDGKRVYLKGVDHNAAGQQPVIDCQGKGRAFYFGSSETGDSAIENFTIENGSADDGGAIYCENASSPSIINCIFRGNSADDRGGAICCLSSSPTLTNCTISSNSAGDYGGAIYCDSSSPTLTNCTFSGNNASTSGGAILCVKSSPTITNCTFSGNSVNWYGGAIECYNSNSLTLNNCILWNNSAGSRGNEIYVYDLASSCTLNYCCVDNAGYGGQTGNITENNCIHQEPLFVDAANGDYHLKDTSPCIDTGDNSLVPSSVTTDLDGRKRIVDGDSNGTATVDIGAYEYQP